MHPSFAALPAPSLLRTCAGVQPPVEPIEARRSAGRSSPPTGPVSIADMLDTSEATRQYPLRTGQREEAHRQLQQALRSSLTRDQRAPIAAELAWLRSRSTP